MSIRLSGRFGWRLVRHLRDDGLRLADWLHGLLKRRPSAQVRPRQRRRHRSSATRIEVPESQLVASIVLAETQIAVQLRPADTQRPVKYRHVARFRTYDVNGLAELIRAQGCMVKVFVTEDLAKEPRTLAYLLHTLRGGSPDSCIAPDFRR